MRREEGGRSWRACQAGKADKGSGHALVLVFLVRQLHARSGGSVVHQVVVLAQRVCAVLGRLAQLGLQLC